MSARTKNDTRLITLCARFDDLERKFQASFEHAQLGTEASQAGALEAEAEAPRAAANQPLMDEQKRLLARIVKLRATTLEGYRARARTLQLWNSDGISARSDEFWEDQMIYALVRDLTAQDAP